MTAVFAVTRPVIHHRRRRVTRCPSGGNRPNVPPDRSSMWLTTPKPAGCDRLSVPQFSGRCMSHANSASRRRRTPRAEGQGSRSRRVDTNCIRSVHITQHRTGRASRTGSHGVVSIVRPTEIDPSRTAAVFAYIRLVCLSFKLFRALMNISFVWPQYFCLSGQIHN
jgi:hypothetical protein